MGRVTCDAALLPVLELVETRRDGRNGNVAALVVPNVGPGLPLCAYAYVSPYVVCVCVCVRVGKTIR